MFLNEFIDYTIPFLKPTDNVGLAMEWFAEFKTNQLPLVDNKEYLGLIEEKHIEELSENVLIEEVFLDFSKVFIHENASVFDAMNMFQKHQVDILPILNEAGFVGIVKINTIATIFTRLFSFNETGGILILEMHQKDYSLTEISRIVESNNALVLSSGILAQKNASSMIQVFVKTDRSELSDIIATFERYNINIVSTFQETEYSSFLKERYDALMQYLSI